MKLLVRVVASVAWVVPFDWLSGKQLWDWQWWVMCAGVTIAHIGWSWAEAQERRHD